MRQLLFVTCLFPLMLLGQINESDTLKIKAKLAVSGFWQGGNVQTLIFRGRQDLSIRPWKKWVFKTQNSYVYQEFGKSKADEDILSLNFLYFNPERKLYPLVLGFVSTNFRREIDVRFLMGAGATFQVLNTSKSMLKFSLTGEYEETDFDNTDFNRSAFDGSKSINTFRGTIWVNGRYNLFEKKLVFNHESYFQPSLENSSNYRWQVDLGLELPISRYFNFKINYLHTFESIVIEGQKQEDRFLTFGITVKSF